MRRAEGGAQNFGVRYFVWKITILRQKIIFFPILGGRAPHWIRPWYVWGQFQTATHSTEQRMIQFPFDVFVVVSDLESVGILSCSEMYFTTGLTWNWEQRRRTPLATWSRQKLLVSPWLQPLLLICFVRGPYFIYVFWGYLFTISISDHVRILYIVIKVHTQNGIRIY